MLLQFSYFCFFFVHLKIGIRLPIWIFQSRTNGLFESNRKQNLFDISATDLSLRLIDKYLAARDTCNGLKWRFISGAFESLALYKAPQIGWMNERTLNLYINFNEKRFFCVCVLAWCAVNWFHHFLAAKQSWTDVVLCSHFVCEYNCTFSHL